MLDLFARYEVAATWATVGFLFARSREERERYDPRERPRYANPRLDPYGEPVGADEPSDPLHYAPSLVARIRATPRQEVGSHTYAHYYCGEPGAGPATFRADLEAARALAEAHGIALRSIVFPRNQSGPAYLGVLREVGLDAYRGNPPGRLWQVEDGAAGRRPMRRFGRLLDAHLPVSGDDTQGWGEVVETGGLANVRAGRFLRPCDPRLAAFEPLRRRRITASLERAARARRLYHLWWHPHNFGAHLRESLDTLRHVLDTFARLRDDEGMVSLTMAGAADLARRRHATAVPG
jgi:hypothetical protein